MMDDDYRRWVADGFGQLQLQIVELAARVDELEAALPPPTVTAEEESPTTTTAPSDRGQCSLASEGFRLFCRTHNATWLAGAATCTWASTLLDITSTLGSEPVSISPPPPYQTVPTFSVTPTCKCLALGRPTNPMIWFLGLVVPEIHCSNCSTLWAYVLVEP